MLRLAILSIIFISSAFALDESHELGVGGCSIADVRLVQSFVEDTVFETHAQKPHVFFNDCEKDVAPHEDRHTYVSRVTLDGKTVCSLSFYTGHFDQDTIFHADDAVAQKMIANCRIDFLRSKAGSKHRIGQPAEVDFSGLSELFEHSEDGYKTVARTFRDQSTGEVDYAGIDQLLHDPEEGYKTLGRVFKDAGSGEVDYEGIAQLFEHSADNQEQVKEIFQHQETEEGNYDLSGLLDADAEEESAMPMGLGAATECDRETRMAFFRTMISLGNSRVVTPIVMYDENLKECSVQLLGPTIRYDALVSINGDLCHVVAESGLGGQAELVNAAELAENPRCASYMTYEFSQTVKAAM